MRQNATRHHQSLGCVLPCHAMPCCFSLGSCCARMALLYLSSGTLSPHGCGQALLSHAVLTHMMRTHSSQGITVPQSNKEIAVRLNSLVRQ